MRLSVIYALVSRCAQRQFIGSCDFEFRILISYRIVPLCLRSCYGNCICSDIFSRFTADLITDCISFKCSFHFRCQLRIGFSVCLSRIACCYSHACRCDIQYRICVRCLVIRILCPDTHIHGSDIAQYRHCCCPARSVIRTEGNLRSFRYRGFIAYRMLCSVIDPAVSGSRQTHCV